MNIPPPPQQVERPKIFHGIRANLIAVFFAIIATVFIIISALSIYFSIQIQQDSIIERQNHIAHDTAHTVEGFIQEALDALQTANSVGDISRAPLETQISTLERLLGSRSAFRHLILLNAQGQEITRVSRLVQSASNCLEDQEVKTSFQETQQQNTYIGPVCIDTTNSEPVVVIAVPVRNSLGDFKGSIVAEMNLKLMWDVVASIKVGQQGLAYVVDTEGDLIAITDVSRVLKGENVSQLEVVRAFISDKAAGYGNDIHISKGINGTQVVANYTVLERPGWAVVVELPVLEMYRPLIEQTLFMFSLMLLIFIFTTLVIIYASRKITQPIESLTQTAIDIAKGDLGARTNITSKNEIGQLASTIDYMAQRLGISYRELETEKARLMTAIHSLPLGFMLLDTRRHIFLSNHRLQDILELEELKSFTFQDIAQKLNGSIEMEAFFQKTITNKTYLITHVVSFRSKFLKFFFTPVVMGAAAHDQTDAVVAGVIILVEDVTKETLLEKSRRSLIAIAAHELRTPLTIIRGNSELLLDMPRENIKDEEFKTMLQSIQSSSIRLLDIVNDFLDIASLEEGHAQIHQESFNVSDVAREALEILRSRATLKNLTLEIENPAQEISHVVADKEKTKQIIINLVSNAIQYTAQGGVHVQFFKEDHAIKISITDTGIGIKPEDQVLLFQKFQTVGGRFIHSKEYGSGMGLYISKLLAESMKGSVSLEKSAPGKGSTFVIHLPAEN